jgi:Skp family chaperone for outer membrane proteins
MANGVEIPLKGMGGSTGIGFVDMNELFKGYSKVADVKQEYDKLNEEKKKSLEDIKKKLDDVNGRIEKNNARIVELKQGLKVLRSSASVMVTDIAVQDSSGTVYVINEAVTSPPPLPSRDIDERVKMAKQMKETEQLFLLEQSILEKNEKEKAQLEKEYGDRKAESEKELAKFEESKTMKVMSEFYGLINDMAKEENISIVIEKSGILYGNPGVDLTEKLKERLRGK